MRIALTGTPGTGKTTVSRLLPFRVVSLNDLVRAGMSAGFDPERECLEADMDALEERIREIERSGGDEVLIIEGHFAHHFADEAIVLRLHPNVLRRRLEARGYSESKIRENVEAEAIDLILVEALELCSKVHEIDTTDLSPEEVASIITAILKREIEMPPGGIDWLGIRRLTLDDLREVSRSVTEPMAEIVERLGLTPNMLSVLSLCFSFLAFIFYYISASDQRMLLGAAIMVMLNGLADAVDGALARRMGHADHRGDFLDHVIDRYSDVLLLSGIIFAGYVRWEIGYLAVVGVLVTSYIGTQAQAVSLRRCYGGMLGRADRLVFLIIATLANALYPHRIEGLQILGWMVLITMILSHITAVQRFVYIWTRLGR